MEAYIGARKADFSDKLLDKIKHVYSHIPQSVLPALPRATKTYCHMDFPDISSAIYGVAQGGDQLRQETATAVFYDEFGFWEETTESWRATLPTLVGGGRICVVSTTAPGLFEDLVKGRLGEADKLWEQAEITYQDSEFTAIRTG